MCVSPSLLPRIALGIYPQSGYKNCHSQWYLHTMYSTNSSVHGDSPGKNTGVGCCGLLQGIFPTQVSCIAGRLFKHLRYQGSPIVYQLDIQGKTTDCFRLYILHLYLISFLSLNIIYFPIVVWKKDNCKPSEFFCFGFTFLKFENVLENIFYFMDKK